MPVVYLGLGSNIGQREFMLNNAIEMLEQEVGLLLKRSSLIRTKPWGFNSENEFLNAAVCMETPLSPFKLLNVTQQIERKLGRKEKTRKQQYTDRSIDIDILLYDDIILHTHELTIPHPLLHLRDFVLEPLCQIAPKLVHPELKQTMKDLYNKMPEVVVDNMEQRPQAF